MGTCSWNNFYLKYLRQCFCTCKSTLYKPSTPRIIILDVKLLISLKKNQKTMGSFLVADSSVFLSNCESFAHSPLTFQL